MTIRSMTGYGSGEAPLSSGQLRVELRSVNHRHLDVRVRMPEGLEVLGFDVERWLRAEIARGRVEATVSWTADGAQRPLDESRIRAAHQQLAALRDELDPGGALPIWPLALLPESTANATPPNEALASALEAAVAAAIIALRTSQRREGKGLARDITTRVAECRIEIERIQARGPELVDERRRRLDQRIGELLADTGIEADAARLATEVALIADRSDVAEELARLAIHLDRIEEWLADDDELEPGRQIGFLLQEVGREANTIGSKIHDPDISHRVVALKTAIERMRQQVANVA